MRTLEQLRDAVVQRVDGCANSALLAEIEAMLARDDDDDDLLTLDDEDIRALLRDLLDE